MNRFLTLFFLPLLLFGESLNTHVTFKGEAILSLRTVTQAFHTLGYKLDIDSFDFQNNSGEFTAIAIGNKPFSISDLDENLKNEGIQIEKTSLDNNELVLVLDTQGSIWNTSLLQEEGVELRHVNTPQWFRIGKSQNIHIQPPYAGKWYPEIAILDRSMHLISSFRGADSKEELKLELPDGAYYLKVSNVQGMKMLKEGMWIEPMNPVQ